MKCKDFDGNTTNICVVKINNKTFISIADNNVHLSNQEVDELIKMLKEAKVRGNA